MNASMQEVRNWALAGGQHTFADLAAHLNGLGIRTSYGVPYRGGRGTAKLVSMTHRALTNSGQLPVARIVARAYTRKNGGFAY